MQFDLVYVKILFEKYKKDLMCVGIIALLFVICSIFTWGYYGNLFYDNGREAYLPQLMLEGKVLFKDIFAMYSPLSYQVNALLYYIFGAKLNVLYLAGTINAFLIAVALYLISRQFINRFYSLTFVGFIIFFFIYTNVDCINYIFPYSYALPYALCFMLYSAYCGLMYLKTQKSYLILLSFLLIGFSVANKLEFLFCAIPLLICLFIKKANLKTILASILLFFIPSLISWGLLFLQGFTKTDFLNYFDFLSKLFNSPEQIYYTSQYISPPLLMKLTTISWHISFFIALICIPALLLFFIYKHKKYILGAIAMVAYVIIVYFPILKFFVNGYHFPLLSFCTILILYIVIDSLRKHNLPMLFLSLISLLSCLRFGVIVTSNSLIYICLLPVVICWIYFIDNVKKNSQNLSIIKKMMAIMLVTFSVLLLSFLMVVKSHEFIPITMPNSSEIFLNQKVYAEPFNESVKWVMENTNENDTVLSLPEGVFINYITKRKTLPMYYHLIPNHITALGEDNIVEGLKQNPPDYMVLNNVNYAVYGYPYICRDFAHKICSFVANNYDLAVNFYYKENFLISIYKKRQ